MRRKLVTAVVVVAVLGVGAWLVVRAVLGSDLVRSAVEQQLATRLGQPVRIGSATAALFPRVALDLHEVSVGAPAAATIGELRIVTGLRGLLSRTIADAEVVLSAGRITWPLPFALTPSPAAEAPGTTKSSAFTVSSVRLIALRDVTLTGGNESLVVDLDSSLEGDRLDITRLVARAGTTRIAASGVLSSIARLEGTFEAQADPFDLDEMIAIGSALTSTTASRNDGHANADDVSPTPMHIVVKLAAPAGAFTTYAFKDFSTTLEVVPGHLALAPLSVRTFGGSFQGRLEAETNRPVPQLRVAGRVDGLDVAELMKASGSPGGIVGRLGGALSLSGAGTEPGALIRSARGTIEASITDGSIPGLDLVRTIVLAFGKPSGAPVEGSGSAFSRLGGDFVMAGGALTSENLTMASRDFDLAGRSTLQIMTGVVDANVDVVLSRDLTAQAGTDLRRYAQEDGRVVVPARITGTLQRPKVSLDLAAATRRALGNEIQRRAKSFLDGLFRKKKDE